MNTEMKKRFLLSVCSGMAEPCNSPSMDHGAIRVIRALGNNSESVVVGRILICDNGEWREVCDYRWGIKDAQVMCRQLGFGTQGK